ncbi:hypothetical protein KGQ27_02775 [Patescibacteria group bacterium]|nr:hypothetical protein [Patescibacteria group bacterium]MDE1946792.1 hypothetical protein [Patescibacteria group bacterium]MDE2011076.1 hypothetical protein [Patescibacteria group bacterium]MDE2233133.1 hypothetical protein [Patescibacteria group bacterium]
MATETYKVGWIHAVSGDHYAGLIKSVEFVGRHLSLVFDLMVRIRKNGSVPAEWHCDGNGKMFTDYEFKFDCSVEKNSVQRIKVRSMEGDLIILSCMHEDTSVVMSLVREGLIILRH